MSKIYNHIGKFYLALKESRSLKTTPEGDFYITQNPLFKFFNLFKSEARRWMSISCAFRSALSKLESIPIRFTNDGKQATQFENFTLFIKSGKFILEKLTPHKKAIAESKALEKALVALDYRLEQANGGHSPQEASLDLFETFQEAAKNWKSKQVVFSDRNLSADDIKILHKTCQFRQFIKILFSDKIFLDTFLIWALRDRLPIEIFIEYPEIQQKINKFDLNGRLACMGSSLLKIKKIEDSEGLDRGLLKVVTLPFEGRDTSILDDQQIVMLKGNYALTITEVYREFERKRLGESNLEFMRDGFINWNAFRWGIWDETIKDYRLVDLDQKEWWNQLPVYEELTLKEARKKFGKHLDGTIWNVAAIATREKANLDFQGAHAYSSIAIPSGHGCYKVYAFGKYSTKFPQDLVEALLKIGHTSEATIAYPDENVFYTHRQKSSYSFAVNEIQGHRYLESIKKDMKIARAGNSVYQIESENCAKWAHQKIETIIGPHRLPNIFQMPFLRSEPRGFMEKVFKSLKYLPEAMQIKVTLSIHFFLGGYKGLWIWEAGKYVWKSLTFHPFWEDTIIYHPSMLHKQQELGIIRRSVQQGITFTKEHIHSSYHDLHHKMVVFAKYISCTSGVKLKGCLLKFLASIQEKMASKGVKRTQGSSGQLISSLAFQEDEILFGRGRLPSIK